MTRDQLAAAAALKAELEAAEWAFSLTREGELYVVVGRETATRKQDQIWDAIGEHLRSCSP